MAGKISLVREIGAPGEISKIKPLIAPAPKTNMHNGIKIKLKMYAQRFNLRRKVALKISTRLITIARIPNNAVDAFFIPPNSLGSGAALSD